MKLLLFFPDLQASGVANNWTTLNRRIERDGFPTGHMIGRRRAWTPGEVLAWLEVQPIKNSVPLKGAARLAKAGLLPRRTRRGANASAA